MRLTMIRHGETKGNREHRYVGKTDEEILPETTWGLKKLKEELIYREPLLLFTSPMRRCVQTAQILYPGRELTLIEEFGECDFGSFEYRNYEELKGNPDYQRFIDSGGESGFPGGEDRRNFQRRCAAGFERVMKMAGAGNVELALIVHGGTIMALLDQYSRPHRDYYDWQIKNGAGYTMEAARDEKTGQIILEHIRKIPPAGRKAD